MVDAYTSGAYGAANPDWHAADAPHKARAVRALLDAAGLSPATVIDVGCGTGGVLRHLHGQGGPKVRFEGWDIAPVAIARAQEHARERLTFVAGDLLASDRTAELILCLDVVEHLADDVGFLTALRDRGEVFLFRLPLDLSVLDVLRPSRLLSARARYGHRHVYTAPMALQTLRSAGFRVEQWRYDRLPPPRDTARRLLTSWGRAAAFRVWPEAAVRVLGGYSLLVLARSA